MHHYNVGNPFTFKHFHNDIISHLENRVNYKTTKNLLINMPVGFGKTVIIEYFISWCFAKNKKDQATFVPFYLTRLSFFFPKLQSLVLLKNLYRYIKINTCSN